MPRTPKVEGVDAEEHLDERRLMDALAASAGCDGGMNGE